MSSMQVSYEIVQSILFKPPADVSPETLALMTFTFKPFLFKFFSSTFDK